MIDAEVIVLDSGLYVQIDDKPDLLGPFTKKELKAILRALLAWMEEEEE